MLLTRSNVLAAAAADGSLPQVLIVEDDLDIRDALGQILEDEGYVVATAANGQEALDQLRSGAPPPRLILLDLMMPVMNGWQFRAEQMDDPALADIPVVVISADTHVGDKASQLGVNEYFRKPIEITGLLRTLERYCGAETATGS
jgi:CheY-like chemotaxis protein